MMNSLDSSPTIAWLKHIFSKKQRYILWAWLLFFFLFAFLYAPNLFFASMESAAGRLEHGEAIVYGLSFWLLWFALFPKIWMGLALALMPALWLFPSLYLRWTYQTPITNYFYSMLAETGLHELHGFVSVFGWLFFGGTFVSLLMIGLGAVITCKHQIGIRASVRKWILLILVPLGLALFFFFNKNEAQPLTKEHEQTFMVTAHKPWLDKWVAVYPTDLLFAAWEYKTERQSIEKLRYQVDRFNFGEKQESQSAPEVVVLVIGESAMAKRWGLYGYERNTTPLLSARDDLIVLKDVVTHSTTTRDSVPQMISRRPFIQGDRKPDPFAEPSLVKLFRNLGYTAHWISNQSVSGKHDSPITFYATEAQHQRYMNPVAFSAQGSLDGVMLPVLEAALAKPGKKLIVLHTLGSHFNYDYRYPEAFRRYPVTPQSGMATAEQDEKLLAMSNSYDNSTLYTDYFLDQILAQLGKLNVPAMMLYSSDHGEDVIKKGCKFSPPNRSTPDSYWIPAFVWANQQAKAKNPEAYARLKSRANQPMTTSAYFDVISDVSAIKTTGSGVSDWLSQSWTTPTRWIYNGQGKAVNYDEKRRIDSCSAWIDEPKAKQDTNQ